MKSFKKIPNSFFTALGLMTRIPVKREYTPDFSLFPFFLPVTGFLFSMAVFVVYYAVSRIASNAAVISLAVLSAQYFMFNLFHFDGLVDSADALLYNTTPEKRLTILKDKNAGSFAVFAGAIYIAAKYTILTELIAPGNTAAGMFLIFSCITAGRIAGGMVPAVSSPAGSTGTGILLKDFSIKLFAAGSAAAVSALIICIHALSRNVSPEIFYPFLAGSAAAIFSGAVSGILYKRMAGGFTGDAVGMAVEIGELVYLAVFAEMM